VQGGVEPAGGESAAEVGHGADRDTHLVGDLRIGLPGVGPQQDPGPISLAAGQRAGLLLLQGRPLVIRQFHDVLLRHHAPPCEAE
jgi:hypothetical protein